MPSSRSEPAETTPEGCFEGPSRADVGHRNSGPGTAPQWQCYEQSRRCGGLNRVLLPFANQCVSYDVRLGCRLSIIIGMALQYEDTR